MLLNSKTMKKLSYEGSGELTEEQERAIINYVSTHSDLDDDDFHDFAESIGADPHEAEEVVYKKLYRKMNGLAKISMLVKYLNKGDDLPKGKAVMDTSVLAASTAIPSHRNMYENYNNIPVKGDN